MVKCSEALYVFFLSYVKENIRIRSPRGNLWKVHKFSYQVKNDDRRRFRSLFSHNNENYTTSA